VVDALAAAEPVLDAARARWQGGATLLADAAAAAVAGERYAVSAPSPTTTAALEEAAILSFRPDSVPTQPGLGLLPGVVVEAGLVLERRWGQLYNLLAADPASVGLGVDAGTAVEVGPAGATVVGESVAVLLDGRSGEFATGTNGALGARYVLLDSFVSGEAIR
jgi:cyanophycinase-like exopeptidase